MTLLENLYSFEGPQWELKFILFFQGKRSLQSNKLKTKLVAFFLKLECYQSLVLGSYVQLSEMMEVFELPGGKFSITTPSGIYQLRILIDIIFNLAQYGVGVITQQ